MESDIADVTIEEYEVEDKQLKLVFVHTPNFTTCTVISSKDGKVRKTLSGFAKRHPKEKDNPEMGKRFALKDALMIGVWYGGYEDANKLYHEYREAHRTETVRAWHQQMDDKMNKAIQERSIEAQ